MLVEFITGQLPWRKIKDKEQVGNMKEKYDHSILLKCLPSEFKCLLEHIQELKYEDKPDYDMLMDVFKAAMQRKLIKESDPYDWEKENSEEESINALQANLNKQVTLVNNINQASTNQNAILTTQQHQTNKINTTIPPNTPYADLTNNNNNTTNNNNANFQEANSDKIVKSLGQANDLQQKRSRFNNEEPKSTKNIETTNSKTTNNVHQQISTVPNSTNNNKAGLNNNSKLVNQQVPQLQQQVTSAAAAIAAAAAQVANSASIPAGVTSTNNSYHLSLQNAQNRASSNIQQKQSQQQQGMLKIMSGKAKEDSQASISCNSESNKNSRQFVLTSQHQPIIKNQKQQNGLNNSASGLQSFPSATPTTTAGVAYMQNNNKSVVGNGGSSQATNSCYTNNFARQQSLNRLNNLNNSIDYTTPIGK